MTTAEKIRRLRCSLNAEQRVLFDDVMNVFADEAIKRWKELGLLGGAKDDAGVISATTEHTTNTNPE